MNKIKELDDLKSDMTKHHKELFIAVTRNLFYTAKHECDICIIIQKKIDILLMREAYND